MSYAEFQIRLFAWRRVEERAWEKVRIMAWYSMVGSHQDPKKMPKSLSQFMSLDLDKKQGVITEAHKQAYLNAMAEYVKNKK